MATCSVARIFTNANIFNALVTCVKCLEGTTERSDSNRVRSARQGEVRMTCLEGTTPQDMPQLSALIEFVSIRATEQVAIFEAHCIRVNSCNSWAKNREQNNLWLKLFRGFFFCKVILPRTPFPTEMTKNNSCFFLLKSCSFKQESRFFLLDFHRPAPAVRTPRAQDAVAPRA